MKVFYSRVSTNDGSQNPERQLQNLKEFDYVFTDMCSGSIPLFERPKGGQIRKLIDDYLAIESKRTFELHCHSIDRLGRSTLDLLSIWVDLTQKGITIVCRNPNIRNIDENGKVDKFSELMMSIISTMSQFERNLIRERQMEGIRIRKEKKLYTGRQVGTVDSPERLLQKERSKAILKYLEKGYPVRTIAKVVPCSKTTITKVKKAKMALEAISKN
jgi:DNA invertase Pin-like site-specific DNA recombinase